MSETEGQQVTTQETGRCEKAAHEVTHASWNQRFHESVFQMATAATIDRLAADVASIKAKVDAVSPEDVRHFVESEKAWVALVTEQRDAAIRERDEARAEAQRIQDEADDQEQTDKVKRLNAEIEKMHYTLMNRTWERDEARAEVERLRAELAARPAANSPEIPDSSPADPPPAAPAAWWLTQEERRILSAHVQALRDQRRAMERCGQTLGYIANPCGFKREADAIDALLARAGSPPVVEVPAMPLEVGDANTHTGQYLRGRRDIAVSYRAALDKAGISWKAVGRE